MIGVGELRFAKSAAELVPGREDAKGYGGGV